MDKATASDDVPERVMLMIQVITQDVYTQVCRGLFEKDKKLFSFLIAVQIMRLELHSISNAEWAFFLSKGGFVDEAVLPPNPAEDILSNVVLGALVNLQALPGFDGFLNSFSLDPHVWKSWYMSDNPQDLPLPLEWQKNLSAFQNLLVLRAMRDEKIVSALTLFILNNIGKHYIDVPPFDLASSFKDSAPLTPIIFVLSTGADPTLYLQNLARDMGVFERLRMISLGQGQGPIAEALIAAGRDGGDWVCLQNCHLASSWMPSLEMLLESHQTMKLNDEFRLWLSSMPSKIFPASILQSGIKLTNEPPKGLRANLKRTYEDLTEEEIMYFDEGGASGGADGAGNKVKARAWKKLLFGLTFFHAVIQERRKYGAIGWNIRYEWNQSDILTAMANLRMYIEEQDDVPYETLRYIMGDVNYGGRVTDYMDQRTVAALLGTYICAEAVQDHDYRYTADGLYYAPPDEDMTGIREYIDKLPLSDKPEVFGLHRNAAVAFDNSETKYLIDTIISIQPRSGGSGTGKSADEIAGEIANDLAAKTPGLLTEEDAALVTFQKDEEGAMNSLGTFLQIEMLKFNKLLKKMATSLTELQRAIKGTVVMSAELDSMFQALLLQRVPDMWSNVAYLSLKPLGSWFKDLVARCEFMSSWIGDGPPDAFWMSAFFFPQGYMTAALQMYARSTRIAIDTLDFATRALTITPEDVLQAADTGVYFYGAYIEGCRWDSKESKLAESHVGETHVYMPVIWLEPVTKEQLESLDGKYMCPFYKVSSRAGTLSTTGHSTNYIRSLELPAGDFSSEHWVRRSVALLASLDT